MIFVINKSQLIKGFSVLLILTVSFVLLGNDYFLTTSGKETNWGLSFQNEGETPVGNASSEYLKQYNSYYVGDTSKKVIYLTFDAGYDKGTCEGILNGLKKHNVKATFFLVGNFLDTNPKLVKRMVDEGHTVGNHTLSHPDMSKISGKERFLTELSGVEEKFRKITGKEMPKIYRPPQGIYNEENLKTANELGYKTFFWSLAYVDWYEDNQPSKEEAFEKLLKRIHNGSIVLLHSNSKTNAEIIDELLGKWEEMGYSFETLEKI